jgi:protein-tyrosine-phosphatase
MSAPAAPRKVLFLCSGNICRSPMAEVIFNNICARHGNKNLRAESAGFHAIAGQNMSDFALKALHICGLKVPKIAHKSTVFIPNLVQNYAKIVDLRGIFDPFGGDLSTYISVCKQLQIECEKVYNELCKM